MPSSTTEIQADRNRFLNRIRATAVEYLAVVIAGVSLLTAMISTVVSVFALAAYMHLRSSHEDTLDKLGVYTIYMNKLHSDLIANGYTPPTHPDELLEEKN